MSTSHIVGRADKSSAEIAILDNASTRYFMYKGWEWWWNLTYLIPRPLSFWGNSHVVFLSLELPRHLSHNEQLGAWLHSDNFCAPTILHGWILSSKGSYLAPLFDAVNTNFIAYFVLPLSGRWPVVQRRTQPLMMINQQITPKKLPLFTQVSRYIQLLSLLGLVLWWLDGARIQFRSQIASWPNL